MSALSVGRKGINVENVGKEGEGNTVRLANSKARIKPTAPLSAFDKENSIEFSLDSVHYLYKCLTLTLYKCLALPYESLLSRASINKKIKEKKKKRILNNDLAVLPSHDTTPLLSFLVPRTFSTTCNMGQPCCPFHCRLLLSTS